MSNHFLEAAYRSDKALPKRMGWRYISSLLGIVLIWVLGALPITLIYWLIGSPDLDNLLVGQALIVVPFALEIAALAVILPRVHERPLRSLISAEPRVNYRRILQGAVVWFSIIAVAVGADSLVSPENYELSFELGTWILLFIFSVVLVPVQTTAEELVFRGYLLQALRLVTKNRLVLIVLTSVAFSIPHWTNPEMARGDFVWGALAYFAWGVIFSAIALKDNGLELSLGVHAANNIFALVFVNTPDSVIPTSSLFTYLGFENNPNLGPKVSLVELLIYGVVFYAIFFGGLPKPKVESGR